jgi:hypothetical protein
VSAFEVPSRLNKRALARFKSGYAQPKLGEAVSISASRDGPSDDSELRFGILKRQHSDEPLEQTQLHGRGYIRRDIGSAGFTRCPIVIQTLLKIELRGVRLS